MKKSLVVTVGNEMMGDDAAGPLLAQRMEASPLDHWEVLDGGSAPENQMFKIRELSPSTVLLVDAADMGLEAGAIRRIDREIIASLFLMTTHSLPLVFLMDSIREFVSEVELVGIQPAIVGFGFPVSPRVRHAVGQVYAWLQMSDPRAGCWMGDLAALEPPAQRVGKSGAPRSTVPPGPMDGRQLHTEQ
jgi:hydrogenase 3 maturation protease